MKWTMILTAALLAAAGAPWAETITLQPGAEGTDAPVFSDWPDTNDGDSPYMINECYQDAFTWDSLIMWDLSSIPDEAEIISAEMGLYYEGGLEPETGNIRARVITTGWGEQAVTWNTRPDAMDEQALFLDWPAAGEWLYFDVTNLAAGWHDGIVPNWGLYFDIYGTEEHAAAWFWSSDHEIEDHNNRPVLIIEYRFPDDNIEARSLGAVKAAFR